MLLTNDKIVRTNGEQASRLLASGDGPLTATELAVTDLDTGESPLLVAVMQLSLAHVDRPHPLELAVVKKLLALGADPHTRRVNQSPFSLLVSLITVPPQQHFIQLLLILHRLLGIAGCGRWTWRQQS